jgi:phage head maturation protease
MFTLEFPVVACDQGARTIEGLGIPFGEVGRALDGRLYEFPVGAEISSGPRSPAPLTLGHDRNRPVGVTETLAAGEHGLRTSFRVDATPDGDIALVQAASGSRGGISAEFVPVEFVDRADGVREVSRAEAHAFSLVAIPAFASAAVDLVAAEEPDDPDRDVDPDDPDQGDADVETDADEDDAEPEVHPDQEALVVDTATPAAAAPPVILAERGRGRAELIAGELVGLIVAAQRGEPDARRQLVQAALVETISTDVSGLLPPQYETTVIGRLEVDRPLYNAFRGRPIPAVGLQIVKPKWITHAQGAQAPTVDADATSTKVDIGTQTADVVRWDWAGAIPYTVVQRSDPSVIDEIYADAVQGFYLWVEAKFYAELSAAAPGIATTLGAAIAEFYVATGNTRSPEVIVMAPDVWGRFADTGALSVALAQGGVAGGNLSTSFAGIPAITSGTLAAGETVLATRRAIDGRITEPVRLTANAIGALNVELAVVGEGLFDTDYPAELLKFAAIVPALAANPNRSARSS